VRLARAGVAVFGILAYVLALHAEGVLALVEAASAFGSAGIFVSLVIGLFTPLGSAGAAYSALAGGAGAWIAGAYLLDVEHPYLVSLGVALVGYLAVAWLVDARVSQGHGPPPSEGSSPVE
jgi:Na+/proline symporter